MPIRKTFTRGFAPAGHARRGAAHGAAADERVSILFRARRASARGGRWRASRISRRAFAPIAEIETTDVETEALAATLIQEFERIVALSQGLPVEGGDRAKNQGTPGRPGGFSWPRCWRSPRPRSSACWRW